MKIKMYFTRTTPNKVVFDENIEEPKLGSLYMTKETYDELGEPDEIVIDIKSKE
jgi:hypothetical protein